MKSNHLLIHELEIDIQGVSAEWVEFHRESIVQKLVQIFNDFPENDLQIFLEFISIDIGKFNNIGDFLLFLDLELTRWRRQILEDNSISEKQKLEPNYYSDFSQNDWDTVFLETKDFFNPELATDTDKLKIKFIEISSLLQRNREQFWRWLLDLGISNELISKFRKFITNQQLPNEAIVAWITSMMVLKDKKPDQSFEKILIQILYRNFTNSYKLSIFLKRNDDEFIQILTANTNNNLAPANTKLMGIEESDWLYLDSINNWQELVGSKILSPEIIKQIPLSYLVKILSSNNWNDDSIFWDSLSLFLINNNLIKKSELHKPISTEDSQQKFFIIQQWFFNTLPADDKTAEISTAILVILSLNQDKSSTVKLLQDFITEISPNISTAEFLLFEQIWIDIIQKLKNNEYSIKSFSNKFQQIFILINKLLKTEEQPNFNLFEFLQSKPIAIIVSEKEIDVTPLSANELGIKENESNYLLTNLYRNFKSFVSLFRSNETVVNILIEISNKIADKSITTNKEILQAFRRYYKIKKLELLTNSISAIDKKFFVSNNISNELIHWIDWINWLSLNQYKKINLSFDFWKLTYYKKENNSSNLYEKINTNIINIIKSEISESHNKIDNTPPLFNKEELLWFESFIEEIDSNVSLNTNDISNETLEFYFSLFNYILIEEASIQKYNKSNIELPNISPNTKIELIIDLYKRLTSPNYINFTYDLLRKIETNAELQQTNNLSSIYIFRDSLRSIIETNLFENSINQTIKNVLSKLLLDQYVNDTETNHKLPVSAYINAVFGFFLSWQEQLIEFQKQKFSKTNNQLELTAPKLINAIQLWLESTNATWVNPKQLPVELGESLVEFMTQLKKIDFIFQEIQDKNTDIDIQQLQKIYQLDISILFSDFFDQINFQHEISATIKINYLLQNSIIKTNLIIKNLIHELIPPSFTINNLISNYAAIGDKVFDTFIPTLSEIHLFTLVDIHNQLQEQTKHLILSINEYQKSSLVNPFQEDILNKAYTLDINPIIFKNISKVPLSYSINTWTNNLEYSYTIDSILNDSSLFLNLILNQHRIPIVTVTNSNQSINKYISKVELINVLFGHPRWRELYVQLTRREGEGFKQLANQLNIADVFLIVNNKFPSSNNYSTDIENLITIVLSNINKSTNFLQTFKFYWIQITQPPNPVRILQIILETYLTINESNILQFIQSIIIPSTIFKRLQKSEKKALDEWINNQLKNFQPRKENEFFETIQRLEEINAIPKELINQIVLKKQNYSVRNNSLNQSRNLSFDDSNDINNIMRGNEVDNNLKEQRSESEDKLSRDIPNSPDLNEIEINFTNETTEKKQIEFTAFDDPNLNESTTIEGNNVLQTAENKTVPILPGTNPSNSADQEARLIDFNTLDNNNNIQQESSQDFVSIFEKNNNSWSTLIKEINYKLLSTPTIAETVIAEQVYLIAEKKLPNNTDIIELQGFFRKIITYSIWFELLDIIPTTIYSSFNSFSVSQKTGIITLIKNSKTNISNEIKVKFLSHIIWEYLNSKSTHWLIKPSFDSVTSLLIEIKTIKPLLFSEILAQPTFKKILINRQWNLPIQEFKEYSDNLNIKAKPIEAQQNINPSNKAIYFPIIETNWAVWQQLDTPSDSTNIEIIRSILNKYLSLNYSKSNSVLTWIDSLLSLTYFNEKNQYPEFLFNKLIINQWIINGKTNFTRLKSDSIFSIFNYTINQISGNNDLTRLPSSIGINFHKSIEGLSKVEDESLLQEIDNNFKLLSDFFVEIATKVKDRTTNLNTSEILNTVEITEVLNLNLIKLLLSTKQRNADWFNNNFELNQFDKIITFTLEELELLTTKISSNEPKILITQLNQFHQFIIEFNNGKNSDNNPIYWQVSITVIIDALIKKSINLLNKYGNKTTVNSLSQYPIFSIDDFFDSELLIESLKETANSSLELIRKTLNLTSNIETSLVIYWLSENFNFHLSEFKPSDNPLLEIFFDKSEQIPESDHVIELLVQQLIELNYEAGFSTDEYFIESLIPSLLLSFTYSRPQQINEIIENRLSEEWNESDTEEDNKQPLSKLESKINESTSSTVDSNQVVSSNNVKSSKDISLNRSNGSDSGVGLKNEDDQTLGNTEDSSVGSSSAPTIQLPYSRESITQQLFKNTPNIYGSLRESFIEISNKINPSEIEKLVARIKSAWENQIKARQIIEGHLQQPNLFKAIESIPLNKKIEIKTTNEVKQDNSAIKKAVNQGTRFATGLCGMIMLAPYYGTLFRRMNLIENNNFKSETEQLKAYSIIFQLAKLHEETPTDYQDLVPRIIVGIPPEATVTGIVQLSEEELEEIEKFLTAVKAQWKLMNNVSLRGFIQSFLLRTGKVWKEGDKWKIEVDTHGADIILKTVPWGFSFIKYPWNPYIIETKWELE